jgi:hypothetical protein
MVTCNELTNEILHAKTIQAIGIIKFPNNAYEVMKHIRVMYHNTQYKTK